MGAAILSMNVTNVRVKQCERFQTGYRSRYSEPVYEPRLCLTGDVDGQRTWVKFPAHVGLSPNDDPIVAVGDTVGFRARVAGQSDDGGITFMHYAKLIGVIDAETPEIAEAA